MLIQEYIAEALDPQPSGEWDQEIFKAFTADCAREDEEDLDTTDVGVDGSDSDAEIIQINRITMMENQV